MQEEMNAQISVFIKASKQSEALRLMASIQELAEKSGIATTQWTPWNPTQEELEETPIRAPKKPEKIPRPHGSPNVTPNTVVFKVLELAVEKREITHSICMKAFEDEINRGIMKYKAISSALNNLHERGLLNRTEDTSWKVYSITEKGETAYRNAAEDKNAVHIVRNPAPISRKQPQDRSGWVSIEDSASIVKGIIEHETIIREFLAHELLQQAIDKGLKNGKYYSTLTYLCKIGFLAREPYSGGGYVYRRLNQFANGVDQQQGELDVSPN